MKRAYSKWGSVALITVIYLVAGIIGWLVFRSVMQFSPSLEGRAELGLLLADVAATVVVWAFGSLMENRQLAKKPDYAEYRKQTRLLHLMNYAGVRF